MSEHLFDKYMRTEKLPHMWCAGCGNGIVTQAIIRAIEKSGVDQNDVVLVSGIGCTCRANGYMDFCGIHTNHGRAIAYATGVKLANPKLKVIVITGDGDATSIGGNHFIHAARRNIDLTVVVYNNYNYGMTGGQYSPTTLLDSYTKTSVYGNIEPQLDICKLAEASGATYVARATTYHVQMLTKQIEAAINHNGFSIVEAMCDCPTLYGRLNKLGGPAEMVLRWKDATVNVVRAKNMSQEELGGKVVIGEFVNRTDRMEYTAQYDEIIKRAQGGK